MVTLFTPHTQQLTLTVEIFTFNAKPADLSLRYQRNSGGSDLGHTVGLSGSHAIIRHISFSCTPDATSTAKHKHRREMTLSITYPTLVVAVPRTDTRMIRLSF